MLTRRVLSVAVGCASFASSGALAEGEEVLWDSPVNPDLSAFVDQEFADRPEFSTYLVHHIVFERKVHIHDITTYYTNLNNLWPQGNISALLTAYYHDGNLPSDDNFNGSAQVSANLSTGPNGFELTASLGGAIKIYPGEYWIGLIPSLDFGTDDQEFHQGSDFFLKNSAGWNPGGGFGVGTDWFDAGQRFGGIDWGGAITITGKQLPTPGALALLGVAGLLGTRRRRRQ